MRKTVLTVMLASMASGALAEWVVVGESHNGITYVDPGSIRKSGTAAKMWSLTDLRKPDSAVGRPYLSSKVQQEYDCKEERIRMLSISFHSGGMGSGDVVGTTSDPDIWVPVSPGSLGKFLWDAACGKRH